MHPVSRLPPKPARVEIIPLIDVIFFLLATFVLITLSMTRLQGLPTNLPPGGEVGSDTVTLRILADGRLLWNEDPVTLEQLPVAVQKLRRENPAPKVLLDGEAEATFDLAVQALDLVRREGIYQVSFKTKR